MPTTMPSCALGLGAKGLGCNAASPAAVPTPTPGPAADSDPALHPATGSSSTSASGALCQLGLYVALWRLNPMAARSRGP